MVGSESTGTNAREELPLDIQMEAHIAADRTSIAYRTLLEDMGPGAGFVS